MTSWRPWRALAHPAAVCGAGPPAAAGAAGCAAGRADPPPAVPVGPEQRRIMCGYIETLYLVAHPRALISARLTARPSRRCRCSRRPWSTTTPGRRIGRRRRSGRRSRSTRPSRAYRSVGTSGGRTRAFTRSWPSTRGATGGGSAATGAGGASGRAVLRATSLPPPVTPCAAAPALELVRYARGGWRLPGGQALPAGRLRTFRQCAPAAESAVRRRASTARSRRSTPTARRRRSPSHPRQRRQ